MAFTAKRRLDYRPCNFTASTIDLTFELDGDNTVVTALTHFKRTFGDKKDPLVLTGDNLKLNEVLLNGLSCRYSIDDEQNLCIENVPDEFDLSIKTSIAPAKNTALMGLYKFDGIYCTQCEPDGFRRITYALDRPDVQSVYTVKIVADAYGTPILLSNGNLIKEGTQNGRHYCLWHDPFPKPSYLFALVAGNFDVIEGKYVTKSGRKVNLGVYVRCGACERGVYAMQCIKDSMAWDEKRFNLEYDLDNFKLVATDFFNQGAMENKSLNIFNSLYVLVDKRTATDLNYYNVQSVIGHEYFHNWTGDRVTLRDWFQLSLKESLTVFRDQEFSSDVFNRPLTRLNAINVIRSAQFAEDAGPMAHSVRPDEVMQMNNFYTVTIYDKGAEVIRMIHTLLGEEKFQKGLALYIRRHDGHSATIEDFVMAMEEASMVDLAQFRRWYSQAGTPKVYASYSYDEAGQTLTLNLSQQTSPTLKQKVKEPFVIPIRTSFLDEQGNKVVPEGMNQDGILVLKEASQSFVFKKVNRPLLPVLLEDFSAPVRLAAPYSKDDYQRMLKYSDDAFIKQNAAVSLIEMYLKAHIDKASSGGELPEPASLIEAFSYLLQNPREDKILISKTALIPDLNTLMQQFNKIDLDALDKCRQFLEKRCAMALHKIWEQVYAQNKVQGPYVFNVEGFACRAMRNLALKMLALSFKEQGEHERASSLVREHYFGAGNMTDKLAAMTVAVHLTLACSDEILAAFEEEFGSDPLTFDNYFRVQATAPFPDTVFKVRKLMNHKSFEISNPNRVRALIGAMALSNPVVLHRSDGAGYELLLEVVDKLNKLNPIVAARILTPLISFKRFDDKRQGLIKEGLLKLKAKDNLCSDVYEKIEAALSAED